MAQGDRETVLNNYIERVMELQRQRRDAMSVDELKSVARELGMSDEDMAAVDVAAHDYQVRGTRHMEHRLWGDAIEELANAVALNPTNVESLYMLAVAYKERWLADGNEADREQAISYARRGLAIDPGHTPSYQLLEMLRTSSGPTLKTMSHTARTRALTIIGVLLLIAFTVMIILLIWGARRDNAL